MLEHDMTGKPRSDEDLEQAIAVINKMALDPMKLPPELVVHLMDIRSFLKELQTLRALLKEVRRKREGQT